MTRSISRLFAAGLILLIGGVAAVAQTSPVYLLRSSGTFVDPARGTAYMPRVGGIIQAIDLATGAALWATSSASLPIGGNDSYVVGEVEQSAPGTLTVVFFDRRNGIAVSQANIPLPASPVYGSFVAMAQPDGTDFVVSWYFNDIVYIFQSDPPPPHQYAGVARVDPASGTIKSADGGLVSDYPAWLLHYGSSAPQPWHAGSVTATATGPVGQVTLKRTVTATGQALPDITISNKATASLPSVDGQYLFVEEASALSTLSYRVLIVSIETGETIGDYVIDDVAGFPPAEFVVFAGAIITTTPEHAFGSGATEIVFPLAVAAFSLPGGAPKWSVIPRGAFNSNGWPPLRRRSARH